MFLPNFFNEAIGNNPYISDEQAYKEVLDVLKDSEEKDFIHLVTMQNHLSYSGNYNQVDYKVTGYINTEEVEQYLQGMTYSDIAIKELLTQLDDFEEKTIVVFWGDHLPAFYSSKIIEQNGYLNTHETPLLFYNNFKQEEGQDIGTISPIYFINHVLELANAEVTPYIALLERLENALPAFEKGNYLERETGLKTNRSELKPSTQLLLEEYDLILYDLTTGKNYAEKMNFY
ncbi:sulfatase-like hydrolase/transferase [Jeotgalibaca arthritidis]|uniref:Sulfatase-like hydrolase/transferase n=1 Tax=Jeotgalibaca arthritidis TaxID=1868794 RepID=A0A6G7KD38_9LACT|nr:sulfatase-like hydrolase/transferase [Jeotgalibaca arthritidis]